LLLFGPSSLSTAGTLTGQPGIQSLIPGRDREFSLDYWILSIIWDYKILENTTFWKLDMFSFSGEEWETPAQSGPLETAKANQDLLLSTAI
jgi:hypothetical protein